MSVTPGRDVPGNLADEVTGPGVFVAVRDGYDAVYAALPRSGTFSRIWRASAYGGDFPAEFAHIGFLTTAEGRRLVDLLGLCDREVLVDVACGTGGPGLWVARRTGASLIGIDPSAAGLAAARQRAAGSGLGQRARFELGTFERTGLPGGTAGGLMSIEAFQYAPDKRAAAAELFRILRPGGRLGLICFEVDPARTAGAPVLGADPVPDYAPLLEGAGFTVEAYEETPGWAERVYAAFAAIIGAAGTLTREMGEQAAASVVAEAMVTIQLKPYPRRILAVARKPGPP